jgi:hypothetical protein
MPTHALHPLCACAAQARGGVPAGALVSYSEALSRLLAADLSQQRKEVLAQLPPPPSLFQRLLCMAPPALRPELQEEQVGARAACMQYNYLREVQVGRPA